MALHLKFKLPEIDLRLQVSKSKLNADVIGVLEELIVVTEQGLKSKVGQDKKSNQFRLTQFKKAIESIKSCDFVITSGKQAKTLQGVGDGIAHRIEEILATGTLEELATVCPIDAKTKVLNELCEITGIGESHANDFYDQGVRCIDDLSNPNIDVKLTHHMMMGIKYYQDLKHKIPRSEMTLLQQRIVSIIQARDPNLLIEICGSFRRGAESSGDIDVLITPINPEQVDASPSTTLRQVVLSLHEGGLLCDDLVVNCNTKYMGFCKVKHDGYGRRIDIRMIPKESFYTALLYFTGSKILNTTMRNIAIQLGYTLNEYELMNNTTGKRADIESEQDIFKTLGIKYMHPHEHNL